jgi:threonylcarbamoyladenosine tRNA methylthiotransferase MtaB
MPGHVSSKEIKSRSLQLHQLSEIKHKKFYAQFIGTEHKVLFESSEKGKLIFGFTENYIKTAVPYNQSLINLIQPVKILSINDKGFANGILR